MLNWGLLSSVGVLAGDKIIKYNGLLDTFHWKKIVGTCMTVYYGLTRDSVQDTKYPFHWKKIVGTCMTVYYGLTRDSVQDTKYPTKQWFIISQRQKDAEKVQLIPISAFCEDFFGGLYRLINPRAVFDGYSYNPIASHVIRICFITIMLYSIRSCNWNKKQSWYNTLLNNIE